MAFTYSLDTDIGVLRFELGDTIAEAGVRSDGTNFTDEDRFFFEQIREKATNDEQVIKLRRANPFDKFQLGLRHVIEHLIVQRMADNDKIVTRYMDDKEFGSAAFAVLSQAIYDSIPSKDEAEMTG